MKQVAVTGVLPQSMDETKEEKKNAKASVGAKKTGRPDTFIVDVKFRKNATWQGTVSMKASGREVNFRSALELMKIMDQAIESNHPED